MGVSLLVSQRRQNNSKQLVSTRIIHSNCGQSLVFWISTTNTDVIPFLEEKQINKLRRNWLV